jgi:hypothetical protein
MDHQAGYEDADHRRATVLIAEARVDTDRSSRYLVQLCRHVSEAARTHPQMPAHAEWSDQRGVISFGPGRCTLRADSGVLTLRAEAPDEDSLRQLEQRVADRLEQIGRRDRLTVTWARRQSGEELTPETRQRTREDRHMAEPPPHRETSDDDGVRYDDESRTRIPRWVKVVGIVLAVLAVLIVVVMLIGGGGGHGPRRH